MHIGLITSEYPPDQDGAGIFTHETAKTLAAPSHDVHVITGDIKSPSIKTVVIDNVSSKSSSDIVVTWRYHPDCAILASVGNIEQRCQGLCTYTMPRTRLAHSRMAGPITGHALPIHGAQVKPSSIQATE